MEDNILNVHLRKVPANRTVCISVVDGVRTLIETDTSLILAARHHTLAVAAANESLERIVMLLASGISFTASDNLLCKFKILLADNGFVGSFNDNRLIGNLPP